MPNTKRKKQIKNLGSWDWWRKFQLWKPENNPYTDLGMPTLPLPPIIEGGDNVLDDGIRRLVRMLRYHGVETLQSCEGGTGHAYPEPTVDFAGDEGAGLYALGITLSMGFKVQCLNRHYTVSHGEITETYWQIILWQKDTLKQ